MSRVAAGRNVQLGWIGITSGPGGYERFVSGPRDRRLQRGDMVWADLGFTADGYWSDYCRAIAGTRPRKTNFWIFPVAVFGSSSTNVTDCGTLKWASRSRANSRSSCSVAV